MAKRHFGVGNTDNSGVAPQLQELRDDEIFISALARGIDPSNGSDPVARMLLSLRDEVYAEEPPTPTLADLGIVAADPVPAVTSVMPAVAPRTTQMPTPPQPPVPESNVTDLTARRARQEESKKRGPGRFASGLIGAAAATVMIAGMGVVVNNADEGSALYAWNQRMFGAGDSADNQAEMVRLASTLEQIKQKSLAGDTEGAQRLIEEAQGIVNSMQEEDRKEADEKLQRTREAVESSTTPRPAPPVIPPPPAPISPEETAPPMTSEDPQPEPETSSPSEETPSTSEVAPPPSEDSEDSLEDPSTTESVAAAIPTTPAL